MARMERGMDRDTSDFVGGAIMLASDRAAVLEPGSAEDVFESFTDTIELEVPSHKRFLKETINDIMGLIGRANLNMQFMRLAIEETLINAMEHGNKFDHSKTVFIRVEVTNETLRIRVRDQGKGFDYDGVPDPRSEDALRKRRGRGIFLMREIMDEVIFRRGGTEVTLVKKNLGDGVKL